MVLTELADVSGPEWAHLVGFNSYTWTTRWGVWAAGLGGATSLCLALLRVQDRLRGFFVVVVLQSLVSQLLALAAVAFVDRSTRAYFTGLAIGQIIALATAIVVVRPTFAVMRRWAVTTKALALSIPFLGHIIALQVLNVGDRVVVQRDLGARAVGRYQLGYNTAGIILLLLAMLQASWDAKVFGLKEGEHRILIFSVLRNEVYRMLVPLIVAAALVAPIALRILAPPSFKPDGLLVLVAIVACSAIPYGAYLSNMRTILSLRKTGAIAWAAPVAAGSNILLNIVLVPVLGLNGSALATLLCYGMLAAATGYVARKFVPLRRVPWRTWTMVTAAIGISFAAAKLPTKPWALGCRLAIGIGLMVWLI